MENEENIKGLCGADCSACPDLSDCPGCLASGGCSRGEPCFVASYLRVGGEAAYREFKDGLLREVNEALVFLGLPTAAGLIELRGKYINLPYPLPGGRVTTFLSDDKIYLGTQIPFADRGIAYGVVADAEFLLISKYSTDGTAPEILLYKRR